MNKQYRNISLLLVIITLAACTPEAATFHTNDMYSPFAQNLKGNIKSIHLRESQKFVDDSDPYTQALAPQPYLYHSMVARYDEQGKLSVRIDSMDNLSMKKIMEYSHDELTGWYIVNEEGARTHTADLHQQDRQHIQQYVTNKNNDTALYYALQYDDANRPVHIEEHFIATDSTGNTPKGSTIHKRIKEYTYNSDGQLTDINYMEGHMAQGATTLKTIERDDIGNPTLIQQTLNDGGDKTYSVIRIRYEYYL